jgi:hypothetical protein
MYRSNIYPTQRINFGLSSYMCTARVSVKVTLPLLTKLLYLITNLFNPQINFREDLGFLPA